MTRNESSSEPEAFEAPRWRGLDRWLEPRWRALLTWVALAVATGAMLQYGLVPWIIGNLGSVLASYVFPLLPMSVPLVAAGLSTVPTMMLLFCWFQPLVLRLNWVRALIWFVVNSVLGGMVLFIETSNDRLAPSLFFGAIPGIAGLVTAGQRSGPWMSLLGGAIAALAVVSFVPPSHFYAPSFYLALANTIYAGIMLYGTDPLPRRLAQRQPDED